MDDAATTANRTVTLRSGEATATVHPSAGGRIGQIDVAGRPLLVDVPDLERGRGHPMMWGAFPMAPWVGRIRQGRFEFDGRAHQLPINHHDGDGPERAHAIHGLVFDREVREVSSTASAWYGSIPLPWEFGGIVNLSVTLFDDRVVASLMVEASSDPFPAEVGWHPWFRKPDRLEFSPTAMYERDEFGLPTGELVEPTIGPWDDCFANTESIVLYYDRASVRSVTVTSDCDQVVVYDQPDNATCVEPQSGPPDAFNLQPHIVAPGSALVRTMTISW